MHCSWCNASVAYLLWCGRLVAWAYGIQGRWVDFAGSHLVDIAVRGVSTVHLVDAVLKAERLFGTSPDSILGF